MTKSAAAELPALVEHWVDEGLVSPEQADRMLADVRATEERPAEGGLLVEAFAYLGGIVVLVAAGVLAARFWADLGIGMRLLLVGACALMLLLAGNAVPRRLGAAAVRLTSVLWVASTGAVALFLGLAMNEWAELSSDDAALLTAAGTAVYAFLLWRRTPVVLQHLAMFAAVMATAASAAAHADAPDGAAPGVAMWGTALAWIVLTWGGLLRGPRVGYLTGTVGLVIGALVTLPGAHTWPIVFALLTTTGIVAAGVILSDLAVLGIGAIGTLQVLPRLVERFFPHGVGGPLLLMAVGVGLLAAALRLSKRSATRQRSAVLDLLPPSTPRRALIGTAVVAVVTTAAVLLMHVG